MFFFIAASLLLATNAAAEHEADHRYQLRGYVLDQNENAIAGRDVTVSANGSVLGQTATDSSGYFSLHLHLHNEDRGRRLRVSSGPDAAEIRVSFDPGDRQSARTHEVNFVGGKLVEHDLGRWRTPAWVYPLGGFLVLALVLIALERNRQRRLRKRRFSGAQSASPVASRATKKRRRKR